MPIWERESACLGKRRHKPYGAKAIFQAKPSHTYLSQPSHIWQADVFALTILLLVTCPQLFAPHPHIPVFGPAHILMLQSLPSAGKTLNLCHQACEFHSRLYENPLFWYNIEPTVHPFYIILQPKIHNVQNYETTPTHNNPHFDRRKFIGTK